MLIGGLKIDRRFLVFADKSWNNLVLDQGYVYTGLPDKDYFVLKVFPQIEEEMRIYPGTVVCGLTYHLSKIELGWRVGSTVVLRKNAAGLHMSGRVLAGLAVHRHSHSSRWGTRYILLGSDQQDEAGKYHIWLVPIISVCEIVPPAETYNLPQWFLDFHLYLAGLKSGDVEDKVSNSVCLLIWLIAAWYLMH